MIDRKVWTAETLFQNGNMSSAAVPVGRRSDGRTAILCFSLEEKDGALTGRIDLEVKDRTLEDVPFLETVYPVRVRIPVAEMPEKITAIYLFSPWWTRPAFTENLSEIPKYTQAAFFKMEEDCVFVLPLVGSAFRTTLTGGGDDELVFEMTAGLGGIRKVNEPLFIMTRGKTAHEAAEKAFRELSRQTGLKLRKDRRIPEMSKYLGWCSWDAFYTEVSEEKLREKAREIRDKKVPFRWILIDDGWFTARDKTLSDLRPDPVKFPEGFQSMIADIKKETSVTWFGVWHALGGYWDGVAEDSAAALSEAPYLYDNPAGKLVPHPVRGSGFYRDWYELLKKEGISFVKVDGQGAVPFYYRNGFPLARAARDIGFALESGASVMDGSVINCMGMPMENIVSRPSTAISRNSDDFFPLKEESFMEHLLQNAYNSLYHNEVYCCDWDMFWTRHEAAGKHALLRGISGGPVYVSDRVGETDPEVLKPLTYTDGRILMMERSARPTEDCIFTDPLFEGALKIHNFGLYGEEEKAGGIAVYNLTGTEQSFRLSPSQVPELDPGKKYWIWDFRQKEALAGEGKDTFSGSVEAGGCRWYVFVPRGRNGTCIGLSDKYAGFTAVETQFSKAGTDTVVLKESGTVTWLSDCRPVRVTAQGIDVTAQMESRGPVHTLRLPEEAGRAVLTVTWAEEEV